jgi:hypothetical protein
MVAELSLTTYQTANRAPHQFSVRGLLALTLVVSIVLTIMKLSRNSEIFASLASLWTWLSFGIIAAAWKIMKRRTVLQNRLVAASVLLYACSLVVPAFSLGNEDVEFGYLAWLQSYVFGFGFVIDLFEQPETTGWMSHIDIDWRLPFACLLGLVGNTLVILGWITHYAPRYRRLSPQLRRSCAWIAFGFMVACIIPFALAGPLTALYPGFGLWISSVLLMTESAKQLERT